MALVFNLCELYLGLRLNAKKALYTMAIASIRNNRLCSINFFKIEYLLKKIQNQNKVILLF
ncbi:MAG: hypothetical protein BWY70_00983 [Bacteroidetes bacterium ADurb.Bin408]|nr:MAG: hypothetical protein BWY70_00983 [Bacteroidetes bacterium ADurb.Bin408]